jgi:hypothetical protein
MNDIFYPVSELRDRYSIAKQTMYERLKHLNITPIKIDNKSHITSEQLDLLDRLNEHLKLGATMASFDPDVRIPKPKKQVQLATIPEPTPAPVVPVSTEITPINDSSMLNIIDKLAEAIAQKSSDPLASYHALEIASEKQWILSSSKIFELIGVHPHGSQFTWCNWQFIASGKVGRQKGWLVQLLK